MNLHLDTNLLIAAVDAEDSQHPVALRLGALGWDFATSSVAWMEFHAKPLLPGVSRALSAMLRGGIVPFDRSAAELAGQLIHQTKASRRHRLDTMIAATAILSGAELATTNPAYFLAFVPLGLKLVNL